MFAVVLPMREAVLWKHPQKRRNELCAPGFTMPRHHVRFFCCLLFALLVFLLSLLLLLSLSWLLLAQHRFEHVGFGMVCGDDGKPYKTRSGDTVRAHASLRGLEQLTTASTTLLHSWRETQKKRGCGVSRVVCYAGTVHGFFAGASARMHCP
jgi:hypothetical protein